MKTFLRLLVTTGILLLVSLASLAEQAADQPIPTAEPAASEKAAPAPQVGGASPVKNRPQMKPTVGDGVADFQPLTVLLGLGFILLLIFASAWFMKRMGGIAIGGMAGMKIVCGLSVGPREKILLIQVGDKQELVGVAPGRVSHLQSYDTPVIEASAAPAGDFSQRLRSLIHPGNDGKGRNAS